jgi:glycerol-3-phosphate dehydrogenase
MRKAPFTLCVVGGGFTGAAIAIACLQRITSPFRLG